MNRFTLPTGRTVAVILKRDGETYSDVARDRVPDLVEHYGPADELHVWTWADGKDQQFYEAIARVACDPETSVRCYDAAALMLASQGMILDAYGDRK